MVSVKNWPKGVELSYFFVLGYKCVVFQDGFPELLNPLLLGLQSFDQKLTSGVPEDL